MAKLIFTNQEHVAQAYELTLEKTTVGRAPGNTLVIPDGSLSAHHCEIHVNGPEVIVRDLGSRNGTHVNGARLVNQQAQLMSGQTVRFGSVEARLELDAPLEEDSVSDLTAVHLMGRIMRDQRRAQAHPKPANPGMRLESWDGDADATHTVTSMTTMKAREAAAQTPAVAAEGQPEKSSKRTALIVAGILALGLIIFVWLQWGRK